MKKRRRNKETEKRGRECGRRRRWSRRKKRRDRRVLLYLLLHSQGALSSICFSRPKMNRYVPLVSRSSSSSKKREARKREREEGKEVGVSSRRLRTPPPFLALALALPPSFSPIQVARVAPPPRRLPHYCPFPFASTIEDIVKLPEAEAEVQAQGRNVLEKALPRGKGQQGKRRKRKIRLRLLVSFPPRRARSRAARFARSLAKRSRETERNASRGCARTRREEEVSWWGD